MAFKQPNTTDMPFVSGTPRVFQGCSTRALGVPLGTLSATFYGFQWVFRCSTNSASAKRGGE